MALLSLGKQGDLGPLMCGSSLAAEVSGRGGSLV